MKTGFITLIIFITAVSGFKSAAQESSNIINRYGPPNYTGGSVNSPSEAFAVYQEDRTATTPVTIQSIYPDPAQSTSEIVLSEMAVKPVTLYIANLNGTIVKTYTFDGGTDQFVFDVSDLEDGVYNISVAEQGKRMQSTKLLKRSL